MLSRFNRSHVNFLECQSRIDEIQGLLPDWTRTYGISRAVILAGGLVAALGQLALNNCPLRGKVVRPCHKLWKCSLRCRRFL